jgi:hypothetical protein
MRSIKTLSSKPAFWYFKYLAFFFASLVPGIGGSIQQDRITFSFFSFSLTITVTREMPYFLTYSSVPVCLPFVTESGFSTVPITADSSNDLSRIRSLAWFVKIIVILSTKKIPYTLHPTPYTLHPTPYTLHPTPYTLKIIILKTSRRAICLHCQVLVCRIWQTARHDF